MKTPINKDLFKNASQTVVLGIFLLIAIAIYCLLGSWILSWFITPTDIINHVHWLPIVISAFVFFFAGVIALMPDNDSPVFNNFNPRLKTEKETAAYLAKRSKETRYTEQRIVIYTVAVIAVMLEVAIASFLNAFCLNFLFATPALILSIFYIKNVDNTDAYICHKRGEDWRKRVCPKCGAIDSIYLSNSTECQNSKNLGSTTTTVTDTYTDGWNTISVKHDEKSYHVDHSYAYFNEHTCQRCGNKSSRYVSGMTRTKL